MGPLQGPSCCLHTATLAPQPLPPMLPPPSAPARALQYAPDQKPESVPRDSGGRRARGRSHSRVTLTGKLGLREEAGLGARALGGARKWGWPPAPTSLLHETRGAALRRRGRAAACGALSGACGLREGLAHSDFRCSWQGPKHLPACLLAFQPSFRLRCARALCAYSSGLVTSHARPHPALWPHIMCPGRGLSGGAAACPDPVLPASLPLHSPGNRTHFFPGPPCLGWKLLGLCPHSSHSVSLFRSPPTPPRPHQMGELTGTEVAPRRPPKSMCTRTLPESGC